MKSAAISVDIINLYNRVATKFSGRLNYKAYLDAALNLYDLQYINAYGFKNTNKNRTFSDALKCFGFTLQPYTDTYLIDMILDLVRIKDKIDTFVIGSTDLALLPLFSWLKENNIKSVVFGAFIPEEMMKLADRCVEIEGDLILGEKL